MTVDYPIHGTVAAGLERVREAFERNFADGIEVGAGCCAIVDGETVVDLWDGYRDLECARVWTADTLVNVYSTTKGIGAITFGCAVDDRLISYDAPVRDYWPALRAGANGLTVAQLLSHQGGLCGFRDPVTVAELYDWDGMVRRWSAGAGGSTGFADPTARLGFGYVMNQMESGADGATRAAHLIRAVYESL